MKSPDVKIALLEKIVDGMTGDESNCAVGGAIYEALIATYGSLRRVEDALHTFDSIIGEVDAPCLRAILLACSTASPARWQDAVTILHTSDIIEGTTGPGKVDQIALSNAIIACSKAGEYEEGLNLLQLYGTKQKANKR